MIIAAGLCSGMKHTRLKVAPKDVGAAQLDGQLLLSFRAAQLTLQPQRPAEHREYRRDVRIIDR